MRFNEKKSWVENWVKDHSNSQSQIVEKDKASKRPKETTKPKKETIESNTERNNPWTFFFGFCQPQYCSPEKK
jgi:hypothetical protein